jgi:glycosyltransferase involved in cell wall biosynthesis
VTEATAKAGRRAKIGIDARLAGYRGGGIPEHVRRLIRGLDELSPPEEIVVLEHRRGGVAAGGFRVRRLFTPPHHRLEGIGVPVEVAGLGLDLLHATDMVVPKFWRGRAVVTIHDLAFVRDPALLTHDSVAYYRRLFDGVRRARRIITVSEHTARAVRAHTGADPARIRVVHNGILPEFGPLDPGSDRSVLARLGLDGEPYFLFVGTIEPRKNLVTLLDAYDRIATAQRPALVLAGADGWLSQSVYQRAAEIGPAVKTLGYVAEGDLPALYRGALALTHPASDEGFGLTVAEALATGTPVVASDAGSLPEITAGAALLVPPFDSAAWADALGRVASARALREQLIEKGLARAGHFSLKAMAQRTLSVYREALA